MIQSRLSDISDQNFRLPRIFMMTHAFGKLAKILPAQTLATVGVSIVCLFLTGCSIIPKTAEARTFGLTVNHPSESDITSPATLQISELPLVQVDPFTIAQPFHTTTFHVRVADQEWKEDFYHQLHTAPDILISQAMRNWLRDSELPLMTALPISDESPDLSIGADIIEFYIDSRNSDNPATVITAHFTISDQNGIAWSQSISQQTTIADLYPESITAGWELNLRSIFTQVESALGNVITRF